MVECLLRDLFLARLVSDFRLFGPEAFGSSARVIGSAESGGRFRSGAVGGDSLRDGGVGSFFVMLGVLVTVGVLDR